MLGLRGCAACAAPAQACRCWPPRRPSAHMAAMGDDELDRLIDMEPNVFAEDGVPSFPQPALPVPPQRGAEPFAASPCAPARPRPALLDGPPVSTPVAQRRGPEAADAETPPKGAAVKRRLLGKQPDGRGVYAAECKVAADHAWQHDMETFLSWPERRQYLAFMYRFRQWFCATDKEALRAMLPEHLRSASLASEFSRLPYESKNLLVHCFLEACSAPALLKVWAATRWKKSGVQKRLLHAKSVLLTYQGPFGEVPTEGYRPLVDMNKTIAMLRAAPQMLQLRDDFLAFVPDLCEQLHADAWACSLELCTKTYDEGQIRVHAHAFFLKESGRMTLRREWVLLFRSTRPFMKGDLLQFRRRSSSSWSGAYYLQAPKIGVLWQMGSKQPFREYPVTGR